MSILNIGINQILFLQLFDYILAIESNSLEKMLLAKDRSEQSRTYTYMILLSL